MQAAQTIAVSGSASDKPARTGDAAQDALLETAAQLRAAARQGAERARQHREKAAECDAHVAIIQGEIAQVETALERLRN